MERPSNLEKIRSEVEALEDAELNFEGPRARPVPFFQPAEVKLNTAAVLREDALYKKRQQQEARALKAYEEELRDMSEFESWQTRMRAEDEEKRMEEIVLRY